MTKEISNEPDGFIKEALIDEAFIIVESGDGGDGALSFRREKYVPFGGPDGGNGGKGGDVYLEATQELRTLLEFRYKKKFTASKGKGGGGKNCTGSSGEDLVIYVPVGTLIYDVETGEVSGDLVKGGSRLLIAKGGRGGRGNASFASSINQAPRTRELGEPGEIRQLRVELKLLADVGIIGYPNAGKSTLLSCVSRARPKIADYPFTTLVPYLGVVELSQGDTAVFADIPGIIEGAHEGTGLGDRFLKHIERTRVLLHLIDLSTINPEDPLSAFDAVNKEMGLFNERLLTLPQLVVGTKIDLPPALKNHDVICKALNERDLALYPISAVTGKGLKRLLFKVASCLKEFPPVDIHIISKGSKSKNINTLAGNITTYPVSVDTFRVIKIQEGFKVEGKVIEQFVAMADLFSDEGIRRLHQKLQKLGVEQALIKEGVKEGDTVIIGDKTFEYEESLSNLKSNFKRSIKKHLNKRTYKKKNAHK